MPESVNQEIELVERLQKRERKKPLARSWLTHFPGICPKKLTILVSWIIIVSCGYRPWDQNCRRTLLTQLTDRFFGRNSPSHGIFSCKRLGFLFFPLLLTAQTKRRWWQQDMEPSFGGGQEFIWKRSVFLAVINPPKIAWKPRWRPPDGYILEVIIRIWADKRANIQIINNEFTVNCQEIINVVTRRKGKGNGNVSCSQGIFSSSFDLFFTLIPKIMNAVGEEREMKREKTSRRQLTVETRTPSTDAP